MIAKAITYFGNQTVLICDAECSKAWGINSRPQVQLSDDPDDFEYKSDYELGFAPDDPGTYEGGVGKPQSDRERLNKWCARECERSRLLWKVPPEPFELPDFTQRIRNMP